jgi:septum site-determining protein MinC
MSVTSVVHAGQSTRFVCRSYMAAVLAPKPPIIEWVAEIEQKIKDAGHLFIGPPVVLDLAAVKLSQSAIAHLVAQLEERGVRVMGLENADAASTGVGVPPLVRSSRGIGASGDLAQSQAPTPAPVPAPEPRRGIATLLVDEPVRSGQTIFFPDGDVTVLGSVGSGAELIAGGSIHVYGTLRGRVMAGSDGNTRARIFCSKAEAELLAIDGHYLTADMMDKGLRDRAVQAWLDGNAVRVAALD